MHSGPRTWTSKSLLEHDFGPILYVLEPLLPLGGIGVFYGRGGAGKSHLAMTLVRNALDGEEFLGRYTVHAQRFCYLGVDMPPAMVQDRMRKGFPDAPERLLWALSPYPINILHTRKEEKWVDDVADFRPDLLIVDTLRKVHPLEENDAATPRAVYGAFKELFPETALIFIHHDNKTVTDRPRAEDERLRGSGAWLADSDLGVYVSGAKTLRGFAVTASIPRFRFSSEAQGDTMLLDPKTLLLSLDPPSGTSEG